MAEDLYSQFFPLDCIPQHDLDLPTALSLDHNNLQKKKTQEPIQHPEEAMKRRRNEIATLSENMRRKKLRHLFSTLRSVLPFFTSQKIARHCIIDDTVKYIKNLQFKVQELQKNKTHLLMDHNSSAFDVGIEIYDNEIVIIRITASRMPRSLCKIYEVVEGHGLDIESADVYRGESFVSLFLKAKLILPNYLLEMTQTRPSLKVTLPNIY